MGTDGNVTYAFVGAEVPECITRPNSAALTLNVRLESGSFFSFCACDEVTVPPLASSGLTCASWTLS